MPDETQRQLLRQVIVARIDGDDQPLAAAASIVADSFDPEEAAQLQQWLQGALEIAPQTAHALAFASEEPIDASEAERLAGELRLDSGLLLALAGDASAEVLDHSITRALAHEKRCEICAQMIAERPQHPSATERQAFALRVLAHVHAPDDRFEDFDDLTRSLMQVWGELGEPARLRVMAAAVEQAELMGELSLDDFVHQWFYSHLTLPLRRIVVALMAAPRQTMSVRELLARVPGLTSSIPLSNADEARRLARLLSASHARTCDALGMNTELSNAPQIVRPKRHLGQRCLRIDPNWYSHLVQIARIETGRPG